MARGAILIIFVAFTLSNAVKADSWGWGGPGGGGWNGGDGSPWDNGDDNGNGDSSNGYGNGNASPSVAGAQILGSSEAYNKYRNMLIAHGVLASLVWVIFVPWAAILLRINLANPVVLKLHGVFQIISYLIFVVAASIGIWLAQQTPRQVWGDVHPRLGLAILAIAFFQPFLGYIHHRIFRKRASAVKAGRLSKPPRRTAVGRAHLWLGRSLIVLGIVNGGLGIRLARRSPLQSSSSSKKAGIVYGVVAGAMFALYAILVIAFEIRRRRAQTAVPQQRQIEKLPTYDESESSLSQGPPRRYQ